MRNSLKRLIIDEKRMSSGYLNSTQGILNGMRITFNILRFGPIHHMLELSDNPVLYRRWIDLAHGFQPDWDSLFASYSSYVVRPSAYYWRKLIVLRNNGSARDLVIKRNHK